MASAAGVTLPGADAAPPMMVTPAISWGSLGSNLSATAKLVRGPVANMWTFPGRSLAVRTIISAALTVSGRPAGALNFTPPRPLLPWTWVPWTGASPVKVTSEPTATGTEPVRPATSSTHSVLRAAMVAEMLPKTVVIPHTSTFGSASR